MTENHKQVGYLQAVDTPSAPASWSTANEMVGQLRAAQEVG